CAHVVALVLPTLPTRRSSDLTFGYEFHLAQLSPFPKSVRTSKSANLLQSYCPQTRPISQCLYGKSICPSMERAIAKCHYLRATRSEEHTSELQSRFDLVCRLL